VKLITEEAAAETVQNAQHSTNKVLFISKMYIFLYC